MAEEPADARLLPVAQQEAEAGVVAAVRAVLQHRELLHRLPRQAVLPAARRRHVEVLDVGDVEPQGQFLRFLLRTQAPNSHATTLRSCS